MDLKTVPPAETLPEGGGSWEQRDETNPSCETRGWKTDISEPKAKLRLIQLTHPHPLPFFLKPPPNSENSPPPRLQVAPAFRPVKYLEWYLKWAARIPQRKLNTIGICGVDKRNECLMEVILLKSSLIRCQSILSVTFWYPRFESFALI